VAVTVASLLIALPLALLSADTVPGAKAVSGLLLVPLVLPLSSGLGIGWCGADSGRLSILWLRQERGIDWLGGIPVVGIVIIEARTCIRSCCSTCRPPWPTSTPPWSSGGHLGRGAGPVFGGCLPAPGRGCRRGDAVLIWELHRVGHALISTNTITPVQVFEQITESATNRCPTALVGERRLRTCCTPWQGCAGARVRRRDTKAAVAGSARRLTGLPRRPPRLIGAGGHPHVIGRADQHDGDGSVVQIGPAAAAHRHH